MTKIFTNTGWIALSISLIVLAAAAVASTAGGLHIEAGGIHMTLEASADTGLQLIFAAAK